MLCSIKHYTILQLVWGFYPSFFLFFFFYILFFFHFFFFRFSCITCKQDKLLISREPIGESSLLYSKLNTLCFVLFQCTVRRLHHYMDIANGLYKVLHYTYTIYNSHDMYALMTSHRNHTICCQTFLTYIIVCLIKHCDI